MCISSENDENAHNHLEMKATIWRGLMAIGMYFHHFPRPHPPSPSFTIRIPSRLSKLKGHFKLVFYVPKDYHDDLKNPDYRYPVVVNYHGGGFTLGTGTDDGRWAREVVENARCVLVSVEYRLAPKYPFSVGIEDCSDAVIYLAAHADELRLDPHRMALSGFSAGANFALTVPLLLQDLRLEKGRRTLLQTFTEASRISSQVSLTSPAIETELTGRDRNGSTSDGERSTSSLNLPLKTLEPTELEVAQVLPSFRICTIISFYPPTDFRISREDKKKTNPKPEFNLPPILTNLFDESYLQSESSSNHLNLADPYLSPAAASDLDLRDAYPPSIILYTCEYDMLNAEGVAFGERLKQAPIGKDVKGGLIRAVPHAFDKKPNPIRFPKDAQRCYGEACAELNIVFGRRESKESLRQLDQSKNVDRFEETDKIDRIEVGESSEEIKEHKKALKELRAESTSPHETSAKI